LSPFKVEVPAKDPLASPATLLVTFSPHVFSEKWDGARHTQEHRYVANKEVRAFCPVRYGCSINLHKIVRYHVAGKAFESRDGKGILNYFFMLTRMELCTQFSFACVNQIALQM
jgi:hypothetical protein